MKRPSTHSTRVVVRRSEKERRLRFRPKRVGRRGERPPRDWRDIAGWDRYWQRQLSRPWRWEYMTSLYARILHQRAIKERYGEKQVLFLYNST